MVEKGKGAGEVERGTGGSEELVRQHRVRGVSGSPIMQSVKGGDASGTLI